LFIEYNTADQLLQASHVECKVISYTYDANGNCTERIVQPCPEISGSVIDVSGNGIEGVTLQGLPGSPVTGPSGIYSVKVDPGWSGTVTPQKTDYTFTPVDRSYLDLTADQPGQNYIGVLPQLTLSVQIVGNGRVEGDGGLRCPGVCSQSFDKHTLIMFSAIAEAGYRFDSSSAGQCNAIGDCSLTLTEDTTVTVTFVEEPDITPTPTETPEPTPTPEGTPTPDPNATPTPDPNATATSTLDPNATPTPIEPPDPNAVPEPGTIVLFGLGLLGLLHLGLRRRRK
jgi:YD repeat-containing protein